MQSIRPNGPCRVQADVPRDDAQGAVGGLQRDHPAAGLRGGLHLGQDRLGGRDSQRFHPTPGVLLGAAAGGGTSGGTRARPGRWWPCGGRRRCGPWPCNGRRSSRPPGSGFPCRGWSSSARRAASPWVYAAASRPTDAEQQLFRAPAFNVFGDGRVCPGSHKFPEEVGLIPEVLLPVLLLPYRRHPQPLEQAPRKPSQSLWEETRWNRLHTRLRTWFPSVRWPRRWRSPRGDVATASGAPGPVGYLVNHPAGLSGVQGIGYDYVLGSGGVYVQSQERSPDGADTLVAPCTVRGLAPVADKLATHPRPHPDATLRGGAALVPGHPGHRAVLRRALGRGRLPAGGPARRLGTSPRDSPTCPRQAWSPSSTPTEAFPRLLLGHRRPGRAGLPHLRGRRTPRHRSTRAASSGRRLRPFRPGGVVAGVRRPAARNPAVGRRAGIDTKHQSNDREVTRNALLPGQRVPAGQPLDHRGRLRRDRRLRGRGPLPSLPGTGGHHRPGRP